MFVHIHLVVKLGLSVDTATDVVGVASVGGA